MLNVKKKNKKENGVKSRLKEAKKMEAEAERSLAVARAKLAHAMIEWIQSLRKDPLIRSFEERATLYATSLRNLFKFLVESRPEKMNEAPSPAARRNIENFIRTYRSLRIDFQKIANLSDEDMEKLFPEESGYFETWADAVSMLDNMLHQVVQMVAYLQRARF